MKTKLITIFSATIIVLSIAVPFLVFGETETPLELTIYSATNPEETDNTECTECSVGEMGILNEQETRPEIDSDSSLYQRFIFTLPGGYVAAGVGMRNRGYGDITISGIPSGSIIEKAYLYWDILDDIEYSSFAQGKINGVSITGTKIGEGPDPCWLPTKNFAYRAEVTNVVTDNAIYSLTDFASGRKDGCDSWTCSSDLPLMEGASLVIIYRNSASPWQTIIIYDGAETLIGASYSHTITGFIASSPVTSASITYLGADGQDGVGGWDYAEDTYFNGIKIADRDWEGSDSQAGPPYRSGNLWDTNTYDVTSLVSSGDTFVTAKVRSYFGRYGYADCLVWVATVFSVSSVPTYNVAVILAESNDVPHESSSITTQPCKLLLEKTYPNGHSKEYYQDLVYCVADYHKENSFKIIDLDFEIFDDDGNWFKTDKYEQDYLNNEHEFVIDAINLATNKGIDLSDKDIVIVIHSGEAARTKEDIGKKLVTMTWGLISQPLGYPPYKVIAAEDDLVGAWAHEIGHIIGALTAPENTIIPDIYNMGNVGEWDLMARGSWNNSGNNPPYMSSYTKEFLQWLNYDIYPKSAYGEYWINSLESSDFGDEVFRYNLSDDTNDESPKYYILEVRNRNLKTWDSSLPKEKVLVLYSVDTKGYSEYGYDEDGMMNNQHRKISIPFFDGVLTPDGDSHLDMRNLVYISALSDEQTANIYRIKSKIEKVNYNFFRDRSYGVILESSSQFYQKIVKYLPFHYSSFRFELYRDRVFKEKGGIIAELPSDIERKEKVEEISAMLISFVLLNLLLILLKIKIIPRLESERWKKTAQIFLKIFWIFSLIAFIILLYLYLFNLRLLLDIYEYIKLPLTTNNDLKMISNPPLEPTTLPDLDLHLYCDDGKHIGMNYGTGEYEIQIPGAIVSGDNQDAPEWIFIPKDITGCHFIVSAYDNQRFLEENPEIAQEIEDTTDSYETYARYIDPEADIYTSAILSEEIEAGIQLEHSIAGTQDITVNPGKVTIDSIIGEIYQYFNLRLIDEAGIKESLVSKLNNAKRKIEVNRREIAIEILNAFINEVKAQRDKHIEINTAEVLIKNAKEVISHLQ